MPTVVEEVRNDANEFPPWAEAFSYDKDRIIDEMTDYIDMMVDEGKIVIASASPMWTWIEPNVFLFQFEPSDDDVGTLFQVEFTFDHLIGSSDADQAYKRAMQIV